MVAAFRHEAYIMMLLGKWQDIGSPALLIGSEYTIAEFIGRLAIESQVIGDETVILHLYLSICIIDWRTIERITHYLSPMLPASIVTMIVIIVHSSQMIRNIHCMIMVIWSTLIFGMDILQYNITNPSAIFDIQFRTQHHVLEGIHKEAMAFLALPLLSFAITIIIKHKHLTVILEE